MKRTVENDPLALKSRQKLFELIRNDPGLHFREIQRRTGLAVGALQYHLSYLEKKNLLKVESSENTKRYFALQVNRIAGEEIAMPLLRQEKVRHLLLALLTSKNKTLYELSDITGIPYSSSSRAMERLVSAGLVERVKKNKDTTFKVTDPDNLSRMLVQYKSGFLDELVDQFVDVWGTMSNDSEEDFTGEPKP